MWRVELLHVLFGGASEAAGGMRYRRSLWRRPHTAAPRVPVAIAGGVVGINLRGGGRDVGAAGTYVAVLEEFKPAGSHNSRVSVVARTGPGGSSAYMQGECVGGSIGAAHDELLCHRLCVESGGDGCEGVLARSVAARLGRARGAGLCLCERLHLRWRLGGRQCRGSGGGAGRSERGREDPE
eukprot:COSAG04_NODE_2250_length_4446_cov_52.316310_2_plen_182_part_00